MIPFIDIHTHHPGGEGISVLSHRMGTGEPAPRKPFSEGAHPWDAAKTVGMEGILDSLRTDDIAAVGEIGLDKLHPEYGLQKEIFEAQLAVAQQRQLPVIIHCVKALEDVMNILSGYRLPGVIFHGYTGSPEQTLRLQRAGYYISAGEVSLHSARTIASLRVFSTDRLFLETDDSGTTIDAVYLSASRLLDIPMEQLKAIIYDNYQKLFEHR